jgi:hypothetical protein
VPEYDKIYANNISVALALAALAKAYLHDSSILAQYGTLGSLQYEVRQTPLHVQILTEL